MKKKSIIAVVAAVAMLIGLGAAVFAYDSSTDPVITLSYLTDVFKPFIIHEIDTKVSDAVGTNPENENGSEGGYVVVELANGDELYASGACDIMLRAGNAVCIAPDEKQGIADYTDSTEILNGQSLTKNHMCLIPRGDGRGVLATSDSVFIMVRGEYVIANH